MYKTVIYIVILCLSLPALLFSQELPCGTDYYFEQAIKKNPSIIEKRKHLFKEISKLKLENNKKFQKKIIPTVVHIIHNYGPENISKAQVLDAIRIINEDFQKMNSDTADVIPAFKNIIADCQIEFRLARIDPFGNCTSGITRTVSNLTYSADDNVKDLISWDTEKYLNIWVVNTIASGAGGYAYYPGSAPQPNYDGIVIVFTQFGSIGASYGSNFAARSLTHELGHYFNLAHTWGDTNTSNDPANCGIDDGVNDTPNTIGSNLNCNLNQNTCNSLDNVQNYMDYSTCAKMFTIGQNNRMQDVLNLSTYLGGRQNLWSSTNLIATGTNDGYTATCPPIADFKANYTNICEGESVSFTDLSYNADIDSTWTWNWTFSGATPSSSNNQNPVVTYNQSGLFQVTLTVTNSAGYSTLTKNDYIRVISNSNAETVPYTEGFENSAFPVLSSNINKNWQIIDNTYPNWERTTSASYSGNASLRVNYANSPDGTSFQIISPNINISNLPDSIAYLKFKLAYTQKSSDNNDILRIYISYNCGKSWLLRYVKSGSSLSTTNGAYISSPFIPNSSQWQEQSISLLSFLTYSSIMIKFEFINYGGNILYIDDINIGENLTSVKEYPKSPVFKVYPNPITSNTVMEYYLPANSENLSIVVQDILGKKILEKKLKENNKTKGNHSIIIGKLFSKIPSGIYFIKLINNNAVVGIKKIVF